MTHDTLNTRPPQHRYDDVSAPDFGREDLLSRLSVIRRLDVGPVSLERRKLSCPYRVIQDGVDDSFLLIYRWEEDVFDPGNAADNNLAAMIAAQVALNYGLFANEIRFLGPFDEHDRAFLTTMADNTACEIYVKRFLETNPFLVGEAAKLPTIVKPSYLFSRICFPDGLSGGFSPLGDGTPPDPRRHAVLSSGGKDSLLTYALLSEMGREVYPIYANESGRHWYTALNAYRYFKGHVPRTARVWMNTDRLFNWMKRHLPFVRPDFARFRSDEYPIRLWTVAVFLFGALPLIKKRGIGRLSVGDEFDTTRFAEHEGIEHFDGLFDQSLVFDRELTNYYHKKGWGIEQFSILRPLSEVLIQKTLALRYPDLLTHQVSCHAAHIENGRVHPCGRCEKCRRIVGMLTTFGANPTTLGYTPDQIENCLNAIDRAGVDQEGEGAEHLYYLLQKQGKISGASRVCTARPEVEKLRIDPSVSPPDAVPEDLRDRLFAILMRYADGAVTRDGDEWRDYDLPDGPSEVPFTRLEDGVSEQEIT